VCSVQKGSGTAKVIRGRVIGADAVYEAGEVVVNGAGILQCVGCDCSATAGYADATVITCPDGVVSPALINTHDHITFAQLKPRAHGTTRYDHRHEWRTGANGKPKINTSAGSPVGDTVAIGEVRFLLGGATSTAGAGEVKGLLRNVDRAATFQEGLGLSKQVDLDTFPLGDSNGSLKTTCTYTNFTSQATVNNQIAYLPHIAEGVSAPAHNEFDCTDGVDAQVDYLQPQTALIHGVGLFASSYAAMANDGTGLIWSPRSNIDLYGFTADVATASRLGVQIALGTDWTASGSMNMLRELACADEYNQRNLGGFFSDYQLYRMVTVDAADLIASGDKIGTLKPGLFADITVWNGKDKEPFSAVIRAKTQDVALVLRGGLVLHGEPALVDALSPDGGAGCESLDVCGSTKKICVQRETGKTIKQLQDSVSANGTKELYDLFFCGAPPDEPSCVPFRSGTFTGQPAAGDADGDGIPDAQDLCPQVFSAIRPIDQNKQSDADGDGVGDACDPCPLKANSSDCPLVQGDLDGDGIADAKDNCPTVSNADQKDTDNDGKGDACDLCPNDANPGATPCPAQQVKINKILDGTVPVGAEASISGVCVTAIRNPGPSSNNFWVQDPTLSEFGGIFVFLGSTQPTVAVLDRVDVTGKVELFQGLLELTGPKITKVGVCDPIAPIVVADPASLATNGSNALRYRGMLVRVNNVSVTNENPDAPQNFNEIAVTGNLRVDDFLFAYPQGSFKMGDTFPFLAGVLHFSFNNSKVLPRNAADITKQ
jgi:hypothetical protein